MEGDEKNLKRFCQTADGKSLSETIDRIDHDQHEFDYSIYEQNMMPIENYKGRFTLKDAGDEQTEITWSSSFDVAEENFLAVAESLAGFYQMGFEGLEKVAKMKAT